MKNLISFFLLFSSCYGLAQPCFRKYEPEQVFTLSNKYKVVVNDTLIRDTLHMDNYSDFGNRRILKESLFSHKETIELTSGQVMLIDLKMQGAIYFEEYLSTDTSKVICSGWLQADPNKFKVKKKTVKNTRGKDSVVVDTLYSFIRQSVWEIYTDPNNYALVDYGLTGEIKGNTDFYTDNIFSDVVKKEIFYQNGAVVKEGQFDFSGDADKIRQYLNGDWIIRSFNDNQRKIYDENGLIHLMKVSETIKIRPTSQYVKILENDQLETNSAYFEGTDPMKKWKINQGNQLLVNDQMVVVEYVSDKEMILKVK